MDWSPLWISLRVAAISMIFTYILGLFAAFIIYQRTSRKVKAVWDAILTLPLVLPPTVLGFFLLSIIGVKRPLGAFLLSCFGLQVAFSQKACILAATIVAFPLMYRSSRAAFEQVDQTLIDAGRTLGKHEWYLFFKILLPNAYPGIISGGVLSFARGIGEFGATAMVAGNIAGKTRTLPLAVYSEVASGHMEQAYQYVGVITVIAFIAMVLMNLGDIRQVQRKWRKR